MNADTVADAFVDFQRRSVDGFRALISGACLDHVSVIALGGRSERQGDVPAPAGGVRTPGVHRGTRAYAGPGPG